ncbi:hypothetical protein [Salinisphaera aquimarina]|uniref:ZIP family metal transporter n=1 Tax=Salinisphaera aquimarina TaxID=2094031 RepID=A0ABV7EU80_9GAMM
MGLGAWLAVRTQLRPATVIYDALAAGVLLASAALYVIPNAFAGHPASGGAGLVGGLIVGLLLHRASGASLHRSMLSALCLHALTAGLVLGVVYTAMPALGLALALAIVAHKLPAGYALARALRDDGRSSLAVALPACAVGLASLPIALWPTRLVLPHGLLFGLASGLFLAVGAVYLAHLPWSSRAGSFGRGRALAAAGAGAALVVTLDVVVHVFH